MKKFILFFWIILISVILWESRRVVLFFLSGHWLQIVWTIIGILCLAAAIRFRDFLFRIIRDEDGIFRKLLRKIPWWTFVLLAIAISSVWGLTILVNSFSTKVVGGRLILLAAGALFIVMGWAFSGFKSKSISKEKDGDRSVSGFFVAIVLLVLVGGIIWWISSVSDFSFGGIDSHIQKREPTSHSIIVDSTWRKILVPPQSWFSINILNDVDTLQIRLQEDGEILEFSKNVGARLPDRIPRAFLLVKSKNGKDLNFDFSTWPKPSR